MHIRIPERSQLLGTFLIVILVVTIGTGCKTTGLKLETQTFDLLSSPSVPAMVLPGS